MGEGFFHAPLERSGDAGEAAADRQGQEYSPANRIDVSVCEHTVVNNHQTGSTNRVRSARALNRLNPSLERTEVRLDGIQGEEARERQASQWHLRPPQPPPLLLLPRQRTDLKNSLSKSTRCFSFYSNRVPAAVAQNVAVRVSLASNT